MSEENKILEDWCKEAELDYKNALLLKNKIVPLLEGAHKKFGSIFDRIYLEQKEGMELKLENSGRLLTILKKIDKRLFTTEEIKAVSLHFELVPLVEGFYTSQVDFLILLLIANGIEFKPYKKRKSIYTLQEIETIDLSLKLEFLGKQGFSELIINENTFRALRNSTAHMSYRILQGLNVKTKNCIVSDEDYAKLYDYLREVSYSMFNAQRLFYEIHFGKLSANDLKRIKNSKLKRVSCANCGRDNLVVESKNVIGFEPTFCTSCLKVLKPKP
ncbi:MAG: hypothetical protein ACFCUE_11455 [Candidatus Bathyarchaeia archaeon]|jgi:hypothetical protein